MDKAIPERVWIDRGPRGGWMMRDKKMPDSEHEYVRTDLMPAALTAAGWRLVPPGGVDGETLERAALECDRIDNANGRRGWTTVACADAIRSLKGEA